MEKAFKYRIYPNREQRILLAKTFGCTRLYIIITWQNVRMPMKKMESH